MYLIAQVEVGALFARFYFNRFFPMRVALFSHLEGVALELDVVPNRQEAPACAIHRSTIEKNLCSRESQFHQDGCKG